MTLEDDELSVPLSALEHWAYCRRQCGLIHLENLWAESGRTAEGRLVHTRVDLPGVEQRPGQRLVRGLELRSEAHRLGGRADLVVFLDDPGYPGVGRPYPVEYKRGGKQIHRAAELQLCGQALCLESMLKVQVPAGALYFGASHQRREIPFTSGLRSETRETIEQILDMFRSQQTPPPEPGIKCKECSLRDLCLPELPLLLAAYPDCQEGGDGWNS